MNSNGEISGFVKVLYDLLITLAVFGGLLAIVGALIAVGGFFDNALSQVLDKILAEIMSQV